MTRRKPEKEPLRQRIRDAGGFYLWFNTNLVKYAGPPQVGGGNGDGLPCEHCGKTRTEHILVDGQLHCPTEP